MELKDDAKRLFGIQDYAPAPKIQGVEILDLKRHADDGGALTELGRFTAGVHDAFPGFALAQVNYSEIEAGMIKAFHLHRRQTDIWYVPPDDKLLLVLVDVRAGSPTEGITMRLILGGGNSRLVRIPPGVAHGARNLALVKGHIIYFVDVKFSPDPASCDEGRLPWDYAGPDIWDVSRG
jgi:dTDP-4-dehydrorhamnose 3,5-epimerase